NEVIDSLNINPHGIYVDGTVGGAGHSAKIATYIEDGRLFGIDRDPTAIIAAGERLAAFPFAKVLEGNFSSMQSLLNNEGVHEVDGILLDLGVSSYQLDTPERGFSYNYDAPLDMRMSQSGFSAYDVVNGYSLADLNRILRDWGEEKFSYKIALAIIKKRETAPITNTLELAEIIKSAIPAPARREGGNPAKRSFQAIRIEVNGELDMLRDALLNAFHMLKVGGRLSVITFHSLEDRITKQCFVGLTRGCTCPPDFPVCVCGKTPEGALPFRKPVLAGEEELSENKRSHSAKLRCIERIK
ncbi:MAG: 16S rRNA (cytosine(1402)-N(4))-methyltransferase RsmH, partial [Oscillospiraceae bacterium]